ncbi:MAG TPA: response regulator [Phnomibacter sp.]|nr:response regulator [Phnomibacter sp.]
MKDNCTILWAEDDEDDVLMISEAAKTLNVDHLIDFVPNGKECLDTLLRSIQSQSLPQLIVLDNNMPIITGYETLLLIRQHEKLNDIPVAFFTTGNSGAEMNVIRTQASVFKKPSDYATLLSTLQEVLSLCKS